MAYVTWIDHQKRGWQRCCGGFMRLPERPSNAEGEERGVSGYLGRHQEAPHSCTRRAVVGAIFAWPNVRVCDAVSRQVKTLRPAVQPTPRHGTLITDLQ